MNSLSFFMVYQDKIKEIQRVPSRDDTEIL